MLSKWLVLSLGVIATSAAAPNAPATAAQADIAAIESTLDVPQLMKENRLPGMSVAVVRGFRIAWAKGYGSTEPGGGRPVTPRTLLLAGSISKPVTALGALLLVESGKLSLDEDVNVRLKSWRVPANSYDAHEKVTLARLLSHTAGFTGGEFFPGYTVGEPVPTLVQVLDGQVPARNPPVRLGAIPGSKWQYSGDGYLVVQQLMMDASGESFPRLMRALVFDPLAMRSSTFEQPLPNGPDTLASPGTLAGGATVPGRWHIQPEMAAGGLWTTPSDLARLAIAVARAYKDD